MTNFEAFEDLLQIWEFASNWLELPKSFKLEELYAGLQYKDEQEEVSLVSDIVWEILSMAIQEIPEEEKEDDDSLLWMIKQLSEEKLKFVWPCIINIFVHAGLFEYKASQDILSISNILQSATPKTFNTLLTYEEKVKILLFLWNSCHDLQAYREYISQRLKEKHKYTKEKQDTYLEIRQIENEKGKFKKENADCDFVKNEGVNNQIVVLEEELKNASRTQGKIIRERLSDLTKEKDDFRRTIDEYDSKINTLNEKIHRLNDQIWKVSLKVPVIGRDLDNEYWFFKDEPSKLYVKDLKTKEWGFYNDDESIAELHDSLISKGIKEKRLLEGLRKIKDKLRMKKTKDSKPEEKDKPRNTDENKENINIMPTEENSKEETKESAVVEIKHESKDIEMIVEGDSKYFDFQEEIDWEKHLDRAIQFSMK